MTKEDSTKLFYWKARQNYKSVVQSQRSHGLSWGRKKSSELLSQYVLPEEVDLLHNLRICSGKKKNSSDTNDYQQLHKFRMSMTPNTDVCFKIKAHRLLQMRENISLRWNLHQGNPHKSSAVLIIKINILIQNFRLDNEKKKKNRIFIENKNRSDGSWWRSTFPLLSFTVWQVKHIQTCQPIFFRKQLALLNLTWLCIHLLHLVSSTKSRLCSMVTEWKCCEFCWIQCWGMYWPVWGSDQNMNSQML